MIFCFAFLVVSASGASLSKYGAEDNKVKVLKSSSQIYCMLCYFQALTTGRRCVNDENFCSVKLDYKPPTL